MFDQTKVRGRAGEMNIFVESNWVMRLGRSSLKVLPFAAAAGVLGSWMVYPALTPAFKSRWGIGPKIEEDA